jgi:KamA family protein
MKSTTLGKFFTSDSLNCISQFRQLPKDLQMGVRAAITVFPFRVSSYVIDELIDWSNVPDDPIFQLTFPQPGMLEERVFKNLLEAIHDDDQIRIHELVKTTRAEMNPHPDDQLSMNLQRVHGQLSLGIQRQYDSTVLYFPPQGQTCHSYCGYCFRWAQFVDAAVPRMQEPDVTHLLKYLRTNPAVTDVLITGGDPLVMTTRAITHILRAIVNAGPETVQTIRIASKSLAYWPYRFLTDHDADQLLAGFAETIQSGRQLSLMTHFSHPRELQTPAVAAAIKRIQSTGAIIRSQEPIVGKVNDSVECWRNLWQAETRHGVIPYYTFVLRDTGPRNYFRVPLARCEQIMREAGAGLPGLSKTARGPVMSASEGKIAIDAVATVGGKDVFCLRFLQARQAAWERKTFFAEFDPEATWITDLKPAFGESRFFFQDEFEMLRTQTRRSEDDEVTG